MTLPDTGDMSMADAREYVINHRDEGVECPTCGLYAKTYKRRVHATVARALIELYHAGGGLEYVHGPSLPGDTHELSHAARWDLITEERIVRPDGGRAGFWRLTQDGIRFVKGRMSIMEYVVIYGGEAIGFEGEYVTIHDALGKKFNYNELMEGR